MIVRIYEKSLHEKSLSSYDDKQFINELIKQFLIISKTNFDSYKEFLSHQYKRYINSLSDQSKKYVISINEFEKTENFKTELEDWLKVSYYTLKDTIERYIKNGKIKLFRNMKVKIDWLDHLEKEGKHLGVYWTFNKFFAVDYWSKKDDKMNNIVMETEIEEKYIDWTNTFLTEMLYGGEHEIRLFKNTPIKIQNIYAKTKYGNNYTDKIDILKIEGKTFYA